MKKQLFWHTKPRTSHNNLSSVRDFHTFFITFPHSSWRQRSNPGGSLHDEDDENNSEDEESGKEPGACGSTNDIHSGKLKFFFIATARAAAFFVSIAASAFKEKATQCGSSDAKFSSVKRWSTLKKWNSLEFCYVCDYFAIKYTINFYFWLENRSDLHQ